MSIALKNLRAEYTIIELARLVARQEDMIDYLNGELEEQRGKRKALEKELERLTLRLAVGKEEAGTEKTPARS